MSADRYVIADVKGLANTVEYRVVTSRQLSLGYEALPAYDFEPQGEQDSAVKPSYGAEWLREKPQAAIPRKLAQRGVPVDALARRYAQLDSSTRGSAEQLRDVDAQAMEDLRQARGAANRLELGE